jgi:thiol-disulfide isomerase/thioredoxin
VQDALKLSPVQKGIEFDQPSAADAARCTIESGKIGEASGWVVRDTAGQTLRQFVDTNADNVVDLWCYYQDGIEVYRDIDADFNGKADQYRWLNTAGIRWGLDKNEDGRIDSWKMISAEEVTQEVVRGLAQRSSADLERLLLSDDELKKLGLGESKEQELKEKLADSREKLGQLLKHSLSVTARTQWLNFGAMRPGVVPAGTNGSTKDLIVYENVIALTQTEDKHDEVRVGTLVQVEGAWRLIDAPQPEEGEQGGGFFFTASTTRRAGSDEQPADAGASHEKVQDLLTELEKIDGRIQTASPEDLAQLNQERAAILEQLAENAAPEERKLWTQQLADTISAAAQAGGFPDGVKRLQELDEKVRAGDDKQLAGYVRFRLLTADYGVSLQAKDADYQKVQEQWLANLKTFVEEYPETGDTAEALLQLAIADEFAGEEKKAEEWYGRIVKEFPESASARKAKGAMTRLGSVGKPLALSGDGVSGGKVDVSRFRGKIVLVHYWATWCEPCVEDMDKLKDLFAKYGNKGFTPVGVSLDNQKSDLTAYLKEERIAWPQIFEPGGLDGRLANELGVLTLPTMLLLDEKGNVIDRNIHVSGVEAELKKRLK